MNSKKLILPLLLMITILVANCRRNNKVIASNNIKETKTVHSDSCDKIKAKGTTRILCKTSQSNAIVLSKTNNQFGTDFFIEIFSGKNIKKSIVEHTDSIIDCPVDFFINYLPGSIQITDLDNNGRSEITFLYEKACRGGIEPADLRLVKIEEKDIYIIEGKRVLKSEKSTTKDEKKVSQNFSNAPKVFLDHSIKKWKEFLVEK